MSFDLRRAVSRAFRSRPDRRLVYWKRGLLAAPMEGPTMSDDGTLNLLYGIVENRKHVDVTNSPYKVQPYDRFIGVDTSRAPVTLSLPRASLMSGRSFTVKDEGGRAAVNNVTLRPQDPDTIDGSTSLVLNTAYQGAHLYSNGTNWFVGYANAGVTMIRSFTSYGFSYHDSATIGTGYTVFAVTVDTTNSPQSTKFPTQCFIDSVEFELASIGAGDTITMFLARDSSGNVPLTPDSTSGSTQTVTVGKTTNTVGGVVFTVGKDFHYDGGVTGGTTGTIYIVAKASAACTGNIRVTWRS